MYQKKKISVIIPVLNEQESIAHVLRDIPQYVDQTIIADNGSSDNTIDIARTFDTTIVTEQQQGYGAACLKGLQKVNGDTDIIVFLDGDYSDYPKEMHLLLDKIISENQDVVIGSRMLKPDSKAVLPPVAQFGNWLSTKLIDLFWSKEFTDLGPFRAIRWDAFKRLNMQDKDFGWTVELQIKAAKMNLACTEVAVSYRNRIGTSKISGTFLGSFKAGCKIIYLIFRELIH